VTQLQQTPLAALTKGGVSVRTSLNGRQSGQQSAAWTLNSYNKGG
jgi:hypothetical protein